MTVANLGPATNRRAWTCFVYLIVVLAVPLLVFGQTSQFTFVNYDDNTNIVQNPWLYPTPNVARFWHQPYDELYIPVAYSFWALVSLLAKSPTPVHIAGYPGDSSVNPMPFHVATLLLHLANAAMVFFLLRRLVKNDLGAAAGALLFAVHPLQVESVAWITETKGTLSTALSLAAIHSYLRAGTVSRGNTARPLKAAGVAPADVSPLEAARPLRAAGVAPGDELPHEAAHPFKAAGVAPTFRTGAYVAAASILFVLALLTKPSVATLPVIVLIIDAVGRRQTRRPDIVVDGDAQLDRRPRWSLPVLGIWLTIAILAVFKTQQAQPIPLEAKVPPADRILVAGHALGFYLAKLFLPIKLGFDYGRTPVWLVHQSWAVATLITPVVYMAAVLWFWRRQPSVAAGLCLFAVALLPTLGLAPFGFEHYSTVGDRYAYMAMIGPALIAAWIVSRTRRPIWLAIPVAALIALSAMAAVQAGSWRDSYSLADQGLAVNPQSWVACKNLGSAYANDGDKEEAIAAYRESIVLSPDTEKDYLSLGVLYANTGQPANAIPEFQNAISSSSRYDADTHNWLAVVYSMNGQYAQACVEFKIAVSLRPSFEGAYDNLSYAEYRLGRYQDAIDAAGEAVALNPGDPDAHNYLAQALTKVGRTRDAAYQLSIVNSLRGGGVSTGGAQ
jgi:tetratricopeptide (TPR) repeat protein